MQHIILTPPLQSNRNAAAGIFLSKKPKDKSGVLQLPGSRQNMPGMCGGHTHIHTHAALEGVAELIRVWRTLYGVNFRVRDT
jgi:hypothetical protein